jgi:hypothetical protein
MPESDKLRFEPRDILSSQEFSIHKNTEMNGVQANESFLLEAKENRSLGKNGEVRGFAKKQFSVDPAVQKQREDARLVADQEVMMLSLHPAVVQWNLDRRDMENPGAWIEEAEGKVKAARAKLDELEKAGANDDVIKAAQDKLAKEEKRAAFLPLLQKDPGPEKLRLQQVARHNPAVRDYIQAERRLAAANSLEGSYGSIAESSLHLYEDSKLMKKPEAGGDRQLLSRSVASYAVDQAIGLEVCAEEKFGVDAEGGLIGISIQCDGAGVKSSADNAYGEEMEVFLDMDYTQPKVQKGLHDLEALDYITGQADRHAGNIFVDPKDGKVTGIDNDLAFPEVDREKMLVDGGSKLQCKAVLGPPRMMHEETASKIENMDPDALRAALKSVQPPDGSEGLNDKQIEGAVKRLNDLKVAIASARNGGSAMQIVPEFTKETYQRALETQQKVGLGGSTKITSYIGTVESMRADSRVEQALTHGSHGVRDPATASKAKVNPAYAAYVKMHPDRREDFRGLQRSLDRLDKDLKSARNQRAKLDKPTMKDRLAALRHGGIEREKKLLDKKIGKLEGDRDRVDALVGEFLNEPSIKAGGPAQQVKVESKQHVGDVLRSQRAAKAPAADQHHAGENNVGSKMAKRPAMVVGGTSSATLRH